MGKSIPLISCDLTGNMNTKELHYHHCVWAGKILNSHIRKILSFYDNPHENGYDNCHWCIGGSKR